MVTSKYRLVHLLLSHMLHMFKTEVNNYIMPNLDKNVIDKFLDSSLDNSQEILVLGVEAGGKIKW